MSTQRSYLICYDIADQKRLRKVEKIMEGYGYRLQESVFFCRLGHLAEAQLRQNILVVINQDEDQCMILDLGESMEVLDRITTLGRKLIKIPKVTFI